MLLKPLLLSILLFVNYIIPQDDNAFTEAKKQVDIIDHQVLSQLCRESVDTRIENGIKKETTCFLLKGNGKVVKILEKGFGNTPQEVFRSKTLFYFDNDQLIGYVAADTSNSIEQSNYSVYFQNDSIVKTIVKVDRFNLSVSSEWVLIMAKSIREDRCSGK